MDRLHPRWLRLAVQSGVITLIVIAVGLLAVGCDKLLGGRTKIQGTTLTLDDHDMLINVYGCKEYTKFDGPYPDRWPDWLKLPTGFYVRKGGIALKTKSDSLQAAGMVKASRDEVVTYFTKLFDEHNLTYKLSTNEDTPISNMNNTVTYIRVGQPPDGISEIYIIAGVDSYDASLTGLQVRLYFGTYR